MKKRYFLQAIFVSCILFAGCGNTESGSAAVVREIPIEADAESTENTIPEAFSEAGADTTQAVEAFEDIEVKRNAPELLEHALRSKRKKCMIKRSAHL